MASFDDRALAISQKLLLARPSLFAQLLSGLAATAVALTIQAIMAPAIGGDKFVLWLVPIVLIVAMLRGGTAAILCLVLSLVVDWYAYVGEPMSFALDRTEAILIVVSLIDALLVILVCVMVRRLAVRVAIAAEDDRILSGELRHRIGNLLTVVGSIARHSFVPAATIDEGHRLFDARLIALADAHQVSSDRDHRPVQLRQLIVQALAPFVTDDNHAVGVSGPDVALLHDAVMPMRLTFHELATNAVKYGALGRSCGRLRIAWTRAPDNSLQIEWIESGSPIDAPPTRTGFGSQILGRYLRARLRGTSSMVYAPDGLQARINLPPEFVSQVAAAVASRNN